MKHVSLDDHEEAVRRFVRSLAAEPAGALLEIDGRVVAQVVPVPTDGDAGDSAAEAWTDQKNARRCELIDRQIAGHLTVEGAEELHGSNAVCCTTAGALPPYRWTMPDACTRNSWPAPTQAGPAQAHDGPLPLCRASVSQGTDALDAVRPR